MPNYEEVFWICPYCKIHIPLIGDEEKIKRKIKLHTLICISKKHPALSRPIALMDLLTEVKQCSWRCLECGSKCGGIEGHPGPHQCPVHYKPKIPIRKWLERIKHDFRQNYR